MQKQKDKVYNSEMQSLEFNLENQTAFIGNLLGFCMQYDTFCFLTSNDFYKGKDLTEKPYYHDYDCIAAIGASELIEKDYKTKSSFFERLKEFHAKGNSHLFGYFGYDLKNEIENLESRHPDETELPEGCFFKPEIVIWIKDGKAMIEAESPEGLYDEITGFNGGNSHASGSAIKLRARISKQDYLTIVEKLRQHIIEGDIYEINFCQEFYAGEVELEPLALFRRLMNISPNPFAAFMKLNGKYILCSSMERFLKKKGNKLISQPIKGTIRKAADPEEDHKLREQLYNDEKERAENVMIVDLVRNDLAKSSIPGTVKVEELFGIYPFSQVHQMISTISSTKRHDTHWLEAIHNAFPMGSMTGAPKVRAMQLIEQYESSKRGAYSGAIGYITKEGDFDLNVVIRTFIYNSERKYLSLHVGSAITYDSIPEKEYEECMVKIEGLKKALEGK